MITGCILCKCCVGQNVIHKYFSIKYSWKSAGQTCTGSSDSLGDSPLLTNTAVVPTMCVVGKSSPSTPAPATKSKLKIPNLGVAQSGNSNFIRHLPTSGLSPDIAQIISASWRAKTQSAYNTPM